MPTVKFKMMSPLFKKRKDSLRITDEEKDLIVDEFYNRILDIISVNGKARIRQELESVLPALDLINSKQTITFYYNIEMVAGDVFQICGRNRRRKRGMKK